MSRFGKNLESNQRRLTLYCRYQMFACLARPTEDTKVTSQVSSIVSY